jgi:hypothetical protein
MAESNKAEGVAQNQGMESISGSVESIVYRNDETGYTVCTVKTVSVAPGARKVEELVTLVGTCAAIWEGEELHAEGMPSWCAAPWIMWCATPCVSRSRARW